MAKISIYEVGKVDYLLRLSDRIIDIACLPEKGDEIPIDYVAS